MFPMKTCCFCCSLETGAYTLGIVSIFACPVNIYFLFYVLNGRKPEKVPVTGKLYGVVWSGLALVAFTMLIIGTRKRERQCLIPYLVLNMISLILNLMVLTAVAKYLLFYENTEAGVGLLLGTQIATAWGVYIWLCVYSLYLEMVGENSAQTTGALV